VNRSHSSFLAIRAATGELDFLTPRAYAGIDHYFRDHTDPRLPWRGPAIALGSGAAIASVSLLESRCAGQTAFHCIYREGSRIVHDWGERPPSIWHGPTVLPGSVPAGGIPAFVESQIGRFDVVASVAGGLLHWTGAARAAVDSTDRSKPPLIIDWASPLSIQLPDPVDALAVLTGSFGNVEAIVRSGTFLAHLWRDEATGEWFGPFTIAGGARGEHCWLEGSSGNFYLAFPSTAGGIEFRLRDNQAPNLPWIDFRRFGSDSYDRVALVDAGNIEAVAIKGRKADHFWRDSATGDWFGHLKRQRNLQVAHSRLPRMPYLPSVASRLARHCTPHPYRSRS
jgi:hypothetical protein